MDAVVGNLGEWLLMVAVTIAINVAPAFMPPTWMVLTFFHLERELPVLPLAIFGALGATAGRLVLALVSRAFGVRWVPLRWRRNLQALAETIRGRKSLSIPTLGLFAINPLPSNHLFIAAGLAHVRLAPLLITFAVGRFVSYLLWISAADSAVSSLSDMLSPSLGGSLALVTQLVGFAILILAMRLDWARLLRRWLTPPPKPPPSGPKIGQWRTS